MRLFFLLILTFSAWGLEERRDMTGDGKPERIVLHDLGGTYPVVEVQIYEGNRVLASSTLYAARLVDLDGDGRFELLATDPDVGPHKEFPTYVMRLTSLGLRPAPELMRKLPAPCAAEIRSLTELVREQPYFDYSMSPVVEIRKMANRLTYSGRKRQLAPLLRRIWPENRCREFLAEYHAELRGSKLWPVLRQLNPESAPTSRKTPSAKVGVAREIPFRLPSCVVPLAARSAPAPEPSAECRFQNCRLLTPSSWRCVFRLGE